MDRKTDKLVSAIGDIDTAYLEEALDFNRTNADRRKRTRFPKLSAACAAVLIILGVSVTAFAGDLPTATAGRSHGRTADQGGKGDL